MAEDPYKVLGVARDATDEEIRRAFRKLAKQLHPDLNPSNRVAAEERFKKVSAAYEIVGDPEKRRQYDRGEIDASGEQRRGFHRAHAGAGPFAGRRPADDFGFHVRRRIVEVYADEALFGRFLQVLHCTLIAGVVRDHELEIGMRGDELIFLF